MWQPATKEYIEKNIDCCNAILNLNLPCLQFWEYIRIIPEKWIEETMETESDGFWVVAIMGKKVIYYNDIEEGFNISEFTNYGKINHYFCGQGELHELIEGLYNDMICPKM